MSTSFNLSPEKQEDVIIEQELCDYKILQYMSRGGIFLGIILGISYLIILNINSTQGFGLEKIVSNEQVALEKELESINLVADRYSTIVGLEQNKHIQSMADVSVQEKTFYFHGKTYYGYKHPNFGG